MAASWQYDVAGLGNALVDTLVLIEDAELEGTPYARGVMHPVDHPTWEGAWRRFQRPDAEVHAGGSCANTIAGLGLLGARVVFRGQVGDDDLGRQYAASMEAACGGHLIKVAPGLNTGKCLALVSRHDGQRTMLADLGAAPALDDLGDFEAAIRRSRVLHLTGYVLLQPPIRDIAFRAMEVARASGAQVSLDVADPFVVLAIQKDLWRVIKEHVDIVFMNEEEVTALCDGLGAERAIHEIADHVGTVVVKLGSRGSLVKQDGVVTPIGIHRVHAVDTTGAGDAYAAGYLYGHTRSWAPWRSGRLGARVAALTVAQVGAVCRERDRLRDALEACKEQP